MDRAAEYPPNAAYYSFGPYDGMLNLSGCQPGGRTFMAGPYFLGAGNASLPAAAGILPQYENATAHADAFQTVYDIEPTTGRTLGLRRLWMHTVFLDSRLQDGVSRLPVVSGGGRGRSSNSTPPAFPQLLPVYLPVYLARVHGVMSTEALEELDAEVLGPGRAAAAVAVACGAAAAVCVATGLALLLVARRQQLADGGSCVSVSRGFGHGGTAAASNRAAAARRLGAAAARLALLSSEGKEASDEDDGGSSGGGSGAFTGGDGGATVADGVTLSQGGAVTAASAMLDDIYAALSDVLLASSAAREQLPPPVAARG